MQSVVNIAQQFFSFVSVAVKCGLCLTFEMATEEERTFILERIQVYKFSQTCVFKELQ